MCLRTSLFTGTKAASDATQEQQDHPAEHEEQIPSQFKRKFSFQNDAVTPPPPPSHPGPPSVCEDHSVLIAISCHLPFKFLHLNSFGRDLLANSVVELPGLGSTIIELTPPIITSSTLRTTAKVEKALYTADFAD
jgi:hypothetical protein